MMPVRAFEELLAQLREQLATLPDKPEETPDTTLRALWHTAAGQPKSPELAQETPLPELAPGQGDTLRRLIAQRLAGTPLAHLTQRQRFFGLEMLAGPAALIPRKETELLARTAIDLLPGAQGAEPCVLDVCTGCGNVAIAIASCAPRSRVYASDLSAEAVQLAQRNAEHVGVGKRVSFRNGDLLVPFDTPEFHGKVDLVTCNPPYIASANVGRMPEEIVQHEPRLAFDGGPFGVSILMRLLRDTPRLLRASGWLVFEVGLGQGASLLRRLDNHPEFQGARAVNDDRDAVRVLAARRR
jgi:release factor glutamine methyltransferase